MRDDFKQQAIHRLHRLAGQLRGLEKMIESGKYCTDILTQSASVQKSVASFNQIVLENHLRQHIASIRKRREEQAIAELLRIYKLSNPIA